MAFTESSEQYAAIPAGTRFQYSLNGGTTMVDLPNIRGIGAVGSTGTFVDVTTLTDTSTKAIAGMKEQQEVSWNFLDAPDEAEWQAFLAAADAGTVVDIAIWFPNLRQFNGSYSLNGYQLSEASNDAPIEVVVAARQNSEAWTFGVTEPT